MTAIFPGELAWFPLTVGTLFLVGIPVLVKTTWVPAQLQYREYTPSELSSAQTRFFEASDAEMAELGFRPTATFSATNLNGSNLNRIYHSPADPSGAVFTILKTAGKNGVQAQNIEFFTKFSDGTRLTTRNFGMSTRMFSRSSNHILQQLPELKTAAKLKRKHDERSQQIASVPIPREPSKYQASMDESHAQWLAEQEKYGLLRLDSTSGLFRATRKLAFRSVLDFLNPIAGHFTVTRLISGIVLGSGLPWISIRYGFVASTWLASEFSFYLPFFWVVAGAYIVAGISVGSLFRTRTFIWAFLLSYLPATYLHSRNSIFLFGSIVVAFIADMTSRFLMRRKPLI